MRAETQNHVDAIQKSLRLLAQRMDRETVAHRLEEFDALIEAPDLWNDPARAQNLMRDRQAVLDAVERLSPTQREVFVLRAGEGRSYREIAEIVSTTEGAARVHYHNALRTIKENLYV